MALPDTIRRRLHNQRLVGVPFDAPEDVVRWLGAVQSQDYPGAKWAIANRARGMTSAAMDRLFDDGAILRTHVMRPTWHFVLPADIRWMLELTAPRVHAANAYYYRKLELTDAVFGRSNALLAKALQGGNQLTRTELARVLEGGGITASGLRLSYLMMRAELDMVICSGAMRGKQFTYALLDERAPRGKKLARDEALAELTRRYFTSHGPATTHDFAWWSGLTIADVTSGIAMVKPALVKESADGKTYWSTAPTETAEVKNPTVHMLPNYDEYFVGYKSHSPIIEPSLLEGPGPGREVLMGHIVVLNGQVIGGWRRTIEKNEVTIEKALLVKLKKPELAALKDASERYGQFMQMPVALV